MADEEKPKRSTRKRAVATPTAEVDKASEATSGGQVTDAGIDSDEGAIVLSSTPVARRESEPASSWLDMALVNRVVLGTLIVAYPERDVVLTLDGHTASKLMSVFAGTGRRRDLQDVIVVGESPMANGWSTIKLDRVLAMDWYPGVATESTMTVDPPAAAG